jgi:RNA polymerase sigma-70 factor (ECF subfamily)
MRAVEKEWRGRDKGAEFDALAGFIDPANGGEGDYAPAAARLGCEPGHARVLVHRLRKAYREAVLAAVADTLEHATPAAVEEELAALVAVF